MAREDRMGDGDGSNVKGVVDVMMCNRVGCM